MRTIVIFSISCLMVVFAATSAHADIYRWTDANGVTHFGERAPGQIDAEKVKVRNVNADPQAVKALTDMQKASESAREERLQKRAARREKAQEAKVKGQQCASAKAHRERLVTANRLFTVNADGSRERLGEEARAEDMHRIEEEIKNLCG